VVGGAAGTGLGLACAPSRAVVTGDRCAGLNGSELYWVCRLQVVGLRLSGYAGLGSADCHGLFGCQVLPGLGPTVCRKPKSRLVVVGAKVDSVPS